MMQKPVAIKILLCGVLLAILLLGAWQMVRWHRQAVIAAYRSRMRDPAYRAAQTVKLQPTVVREMMAAFPDATIQPHPQATDGSTAYEVRIPPANVRKLPSMYAQMLRVCGKYRKQGYQGTFLFYTNNKLLKSVSIK
jgi:hypothetical protein